MVPGLVNLCTRFLESSLSLDNVLDLLEQGQQVDEQTLVDRCLSLIMAKTREIFHSPKWHHLGKAGVEAILECPNLSVSELEVFDACVNWAEAQCKQANIEANPENQRKILGKLIYKIHMTNLSLQEFSEKVVPMEILNEREELKVYKKLTNPSFDMEIPFASGRQNSLQLLKPLHILEQESGGECNYDTETFTYTLHVHHPICLVELHIYDLSGPHVLALKIKSKNNQRGGDGKLLAPFGYSRDPLTHSRKYTEKNYRVFVFNLGEAVNLSATSYEMSVTLEGEFDTELFEALQYGDKNITCSRQDKESLLFGFGYREEEQDGKNPKPAVGTLTSASSENKQGEQSADGAYMNMNMHPAPPLPPRKPSIKQQGPTKKTT